MIWLRALAVWLAIFAAEAAHGVARMLFLVPRVGDLPARQIGVAAGSLLILLIAWWTVPWLGARTRREWRAIGILWVVLMIAAEVLIGRYAFGYPWPRLAEDFDPTRGGLLGLGLLVLLLAPGWMARLRGLPVAGGWQ
jgi:hypothetical protein